MKTKRNKIEIIFDILKAIQNKQGKIKPTHLLYKSNLSYKKMNEYLDDLITKSMVSSVMEKNNKKFYTITETGLTFLQEYKKMREFTDSFGL